MNIRLALVLTISIGLSLIGCTTPSDEAQLEKLMRHRSWPRIQQVAKAEVEKQEKFLGWPETATYLPWEHKKGIWDVVAMPGTSRGDTGRVVIVMINDDGKVLAYQRRSGGLR